MIRSGIAALVGGRGTLGDSAADRVPLPDSSKHCVPFSNERLATASTLPASASSVAADASHGVSGFLNSRLSQNFDHIGLTGGCSRAESLYSQLDSAFGDKGGGPSVLFLFVSNLDVVLSGTPVQRRRSSLLSFRHRVAVATKTREANGPRLTFSICTYRNP